MDGRVRQLWRFLIITACFFFSSCQQYRQQKAQEETFFRPNEIVSYKPVDLRKEVVTVGKYTPFDSDALEQLLETQFPEIDFVFLERTVGSESKAYFEEWGDHGDLEDMLFVPKIYGDAKPYFYDFSGEDFLDGFSLTALQSVSVDGKIFRIPLTTSAFGIFYNKTLFDERGWKIPEDLDEFYRLCDEITDTGIRPFVPCFKYNETISSVGAGLCSGQLFDNVDTIVQLKDYSAGKKIDCTILKPIFEAIKKLYDKGIINDSDFASSATKNRQKLYEGSIAMIPYDISFYQFYRQEHPSCEIGFFGYPTEKNGERWVEVQSKTSSFLTVTNKVMENPHKKRLILDICTYLMTDEGQEVLVKALGGTSNLKNKKTNLPPALEEINECISDGRSFFTIEMPSGKKGLEIYKDWVKGKISEDEMVAFYATKSAPMPTIAERSPFATAAKDFTILETSEYIADALKKATGADIALLLNNSYYKSNLSAIHKGEIRIPERFYLKGLTDNDAITTYEITGEDLRKLLEHPIINGKEENVLYACSGLKMTYAPWAEADKQVQSVTLSDGSPIEDGKSYTVAAWSSTIDEAYITKTVKSYGELGTNTIFVSEWMAKEGTISPSGDDRLTLDWKNRVPLP